jgi:hypothetical protein
MPPRRLRSVRSQLTTSIFLHLLSCIVFALVVQAIRIKDIKLIQRYYLLRTGRQILPKHMSITSLHCQFDLQDRGSVCTIKKFMRNANGTSGNKTNGARKDFGSRCIKYWGHVLQNVLLRPHSDPLFKVGAGQK